MEQIFEIGTTYSPSPQQVALIDSLFSSLTVKLNTKRFCAVAINDDINFDDYPSLLEQQNKLDKDDGYFSDLFHVKCIRKRKIFGPSLVFDCQ